MSSFILVSLTLFLSEEHVLCGFLWKTLAIHFHIRFLSFTHTSVFLLLPFLLFPQLFLIVCSGYE